MFAEELREWANKPVKQLIFVDLEVSGYISWDHTLGLEFAGLNDWEDLNLIIGDIEAFTQVFGTLVGLRVLDLFMVFAG